MGKKTKILIQIFSLVWILFAIFIYFFSFTQTEKCSLNRGCVSIAKKTWKIGVNERHRYYFESFTGSIGVSADKSHVINPIIYIVLGVFLLYLANTFYEKYIEKKKIFNHKFSPFYLFIIFTVIFFFVYERWLNFYNLKDPIKFHSIFYTYPLLVLQLSSISLLILGFGKRIISKFFSKYLDSKDDLTQLLISFAFGLMPLIFLLFLMALLKIFIFKYVLILFALILIFSIKEMRFWIQKFFSPSIEIKTNFFSPFILLFLLILIFIAHNFLELIRPLPIGFDDLTSYQNNAKLMAESGSLISGVRSYYVELFSGLGIVLFKRVEISLLLTFTGGLVALMAFYQVIKTYFVFRGFEARKAANLAMLGSAIFYTLPMTVFQSSKDMKVDLIAFFFALMALLCFLWWKEKFVNSKKFNFNLLYISAFMVGFAVAIKYTNVLFLVILVLYLGLTLYQKKVEIKKYLIIIYFLIVALIPTAPMAIRNIIQTKSFNQVDISYGRPVNETFVIDPAFKEDSSIEPNFQKYMSTKSTGGREEVGRYIGYDKAWKKYLLLPIRVTQNHFITGTYIDISFLFLAFVPLFFLFCIFRKKEKGKKLIFEMAILTLTYWLLWAYVASGIIWYGLSGFIFLMILLLETLDFTKNYFNRFLYLFIMIVIVFWLASTTILRTTFLMEYSLAIDPIGLQYARGEIDKKKYADGKFQPYLGIVDQINQDIEKNKSAFVNEKKDNPPKIYRIGTMYKYMIKDNDRTVLDDQLLDVFAYAYQDKDDQKMMERFINSGIKYLIIDRNLMNLDSTPEKSLVAKGNLFLNFLKNNNSRFELLTSPEDTRMMIFRIK